MADMLATERTLAREIVPAVERAVPGVEVLAVELLSPSRFCVYVDHPEGVDHALCARVTEILDDYRSSYTIDVSSPGPSGPCARRRTSARPSARPSRSARLPRSRARSGFAAQWWPWTTVRSASPQATRRSTSPTSDRTGQSDRRGIGAAMSEEIIEGIRTIEREKGIETGTLVAALEDALLAAYKKTPGAARHAEVILDDDGEFKVFAIQIPAELETRLLEEAREAAIDELERIEEETGERQHTLINDDDLDLDWSQVPDADSSRSDVTPHDFGRIAAMTAKQVIQQRIREAERAMMYDEYVDRQGEVVTGIVQQAGDRNNVLVDLGKVEALLPRSEQVDGERYEQGSRIKAVITEVRSGTKGPQVILSRRDPELIKTLFELEVPEIADGLVEIRGVAREPGYRSKIAVESHVQGVDPVGACVGPRGSRVRMVVSELRGEKIDIIPWNTEPARFVAKALSPARVREVYIDDDTREATVVVPDDQLALAIGKEGLNARLAARLTGWKVDIQSDTEFAQSEADAAFAGEDDTQEFSGRCAATLSNGKRCPNAALPGSHYCGVPAHQAVAQHRCAPVRSRRRTSRGRDRGRRATPSRRTAAAARGRGRGGRRHRGDHARGRAGSRTRSRRRRRGSRGRSRRRRARVDDRARRGCRRAAEGDEHAAA